MKRLAKIFIVLLMPSLLFFGCKKKEEQPVPKVPQGEIPMTQPMQPMPPMQTPAMPHDTEGPKVEKTVVVPENVKGKWSKVKLVLEDKASKKSSEYSVKLNSEFNVPNTNLKIAVGEFLPDFRMSASTLTSGSNDPNNPAVKVEIFENGKTVFKGWLFAKFPTMHPFEHPQYGIVLKEGVKG